MCRRILAALCLTAVLAGARTATAQDWRTVTSMRQYQGEEELSVDVEYGAGRLELAPDADGLLYRARIRYDAELFEPEMDYRSGRLQLGLGGGGGPFRLRDSASGSRLTLALSAQAPLDLSLAFGAVEADLELGGLRLRDASVSTGASETTLRFSQPNPERADRVAFEVGAAAFRAHHLGNANADRIRVEGGVGDILLDFTGEWRGDTRADIDVGVGSLTLRLPRGLGVRVERDSFLASFDGQELTRRGDSYFSESWEQADHRLTLDIDAAFSSIDIRWVDGSTASRTR